MLGINTSSIEYKMVVMTSKASQFMMENIFPVAFVIGSFWNILIIIYFVKINAMSSYHFLIVNLAIADLMTSGGVALVAYNLNNWRLGKFACSFLFDMFIKVCPTVSCFILVFISYIRYRVIAYPFERRINKKQCSLVCLAIWIVAILLYIYLFINRRLVKVGEDLQCVVENNIINKRFLINLAIGSLLDSFLPSFSMYRFYRMISKKLEADENSNTLQIHEQSRQRNRRAVRTIKALIMLYAIAVIPGRITDILLTVHLYVVINKFLTAVPLLVSFHHIMYVITSFCIHLNNILNFFIYARMIPGFQTFLLRLFTCGSCGSSNSIH
ncbi:proteinase-activated receptor 2-like [Clytia hemisphaerica]|uniref:proteinase-activated receptor 2-like n=1 Tax=Clytia hemisphaerica TaxID=252671 RepID=UPI0034D680EB